MKEAHISAVIFDLDGTLLDTETLHKTLLIEFLEKYGKIVDSEKEEKRVGQSMKEFAISIVSDYELPMTPDEFSDQIMPMSVQRWHQVKALPGVNRLMSYLHKNHYPMAIASNSTRKNILTKISHQLGWKEKFCVFVGGDEVKNGKPSPDIFIEAAKRLGVDASNCLVIEDSLVGVRAAKDSGAYVVAVPSLPNQDNHYFIAHSILHSLLEFQPESWRLPAFDDLVQKVLPIEVLTIHGYIVGKAAHNGCTLDIIEENDSFASLPCQFSGVFIGWAQVQNHGLYKILASVGWDALGSSKRVIRSRLLGNINGFEFKDKVEIAFVGFVRKLHREGFHFSLSLQNRFFLSRANCKIKQDDSKSNEMLTLNLHLDPRISTTLKPTMTVKSTTTTIAALCYEIDDDNTRIWISTLDSVGYARSIECIRRR